MNNAKIKDLAGLDKYQTLAMETAVFPEAMDIVYCTLALNGEAGELAEKVKKVLRDDNGAWTDEKLKAAGLELGDVLWYVANLANQLGYSLSDIAQLNLDKLQGRVARETVRGSGDNR